MNTDHWGYPKSRPYWIKKNQSKGILFECSACGGSCHCINPRSVKRSGMNLCDYAYCPRCGAMMDVPDNRGPASYTKEGIHAWEHETGVRRWPDKHHL